MLLFHPLKSAQTSIKTLKNAITLARKSPKGAISGMEGFFLSVIPLLSSGFLVGGYFGSIVSARLGLSTPTQISNGNMGAKLASLTRPDAVLNNITLATTPDSMPTVTTASQAAVSGGTAGNLTPTELIAHGQNVLSPMSQGNVSEALNTLFTTDYSSGNLSSMEQFETIRGTLFNTSAINEITTRCGFGEMMAENPANAEPFNQTIMSQIASGAPINNTTLNSLHSAATAPIKVVNTIGSPENLQHTVGNGLVSVAGIKPDSAIILLFSIVGLTLSGVIAAKVCPYIARKAYDHYVNADTPKAQNG